MVLAAVMLFSLLCWLLWAFIPRSGVRYGILAVTGGVFVLAGLWIWFWQRQIYTFADEICDTLDALISGRQPELERPYEDSVTAKVHPSAASADRGKTCGISGNYGVTDQ